MSITVGEVTVEATRDTAPAPTPNGNSARPRPDADEIRVILRRDNDRRERLWVD